MSQSKPRCPNSYHPVALWPSFQLEDELVREVMAKSGRRLQFVAGVDEVGTGAIAGPVVAGAVVLQIRRIDWYRELDDSKRLSRQKREHLDKLIRRHAVAYGIGEVLERDLDAWGMNRTRTVAMQRALSDLRQRIPNVTQLGVLVDGKSMRAQNVTDGLPALYTNAADAKSLSVAAASILAKVFRDREMRALARSIPGYGFEANVGYASPEHRRALKERGPSSSHRRSFGPVRAAAGTR